MSKLLTLNIGSSKATIAEYTLGGKRSLTLNAYGEVDLAAADVDAAGSLEATLAPALRSVMREKGIKPAPLVLSLSGSMVFPRFSKFPAVGADKLEQMVHYEVEQNVPFPIDEIVSDHQFLGKTADGEEAAIIVAAKLDQVREVTSAVRAAGLEPVIVDVSPMAVCNALSYVAPGLSGCNVILDMGSKTTNLIIIEGEKIYNRSIPVAGNTITKEIASAFGISAEEAESLKRERGYVSLGGVTEDEDEVADRISKIIRSVLTRLHAEISRSINFYRSQQGGSAPAKLYLTGGSVRIPQVDSFFRETLRVDVEFLNPFASLGIGPKVNREALGSDAFSLAESTGLALRMTDAARIKINLLPPELVERARNLKRVPFVAISGVLVLAALGMGILVETNRADAAKACIEEVEAKNSQLGSLQKKLEAEQANVKKSFEQCDAFQMRLAERSVVLQRVAAVRKALVKGMWITKWAPNKTLSAEASDNNAVGTKIDVTIRGWSDSLSKAETEWAAKNAGKKATATEIVQTALKGCKLFDPDSIKIASTKDVKGCLTEFTIQMVCAPVESAQSSGKANSKKKGAAK